MENLFTYADYVWIYDESALIQHFLDRFQEWYLVTPEMVRAALVAVNPKICTDDGAPYLPIDDDRATMTHIRCAVDANPAYHEGMRRWVMEMEAKQREAAKRRKMRREAKLLKLLTQQPNLN